MKRVRLASHLARAARRAALARLLVLGAALAPALVAPPPAAAAPQPGPPGVDAPQALRARELFRKGREEYAKEGHNPQAYALFLEAWALQKSFDIAGNLAFVERQLSHPRDACEHASFALANFPAGGTDAQRKALQDLLADARTSVGAITLRVSVDHAAITVDGQPAGESPLPYEVFVDPGSHTIAATAPGCDPVKDTVRTDKGTTHLLTLTPTRCGPAPPKLPPGTPVEPQGPRPLTVAGFVTTGAGLALGTAFAILSKTKADSANQSQQTLQSTAGGNAQACAGAAPPAGCATLGSLRSSEAMFANASLWSFVAAGAVGAGTLIYTFAVPRAPAAPVATTSRLQVIPLAGPTAGGLMLKGAF